MKNLKQCRKRVLAALCVFALALVPATVIAVETEVEIPENRNAATEIHESSNTATEFTEPESTASPITPLSASTATNTLAINVVHFNGNAVIEITNPTDRAISCKGMYLTDDPDDLFKWQMPSVIVREESVFVRGDSDSETPVLKRMTANFEVESAERILLVDAGGNVIAEWFREHEGYLVIPEWGVKFTIPDTITDVRYFIDNDIAYFFAKPVGANLEFASDLDSNFQAYTRVIIMRGLVTEDTEVYFKRIGDYYFEPGAGGGYTGLFGDEDTAEYEQEAVWGLMRMIETIQALR